MFTGIIEEIGRVDRVAPAGDGRRLRIGCSFASALRTDQSIAVSGVCQTVVAVADGTFEVVAVEETLSKTTLGLLKSGSRVNLERAMQPTGRLDGHFVQGHVDGTAEVRDVRELSSSWMIQIGLDARWRASVIPVGSIAVDGISLTVARLHDDAFSVAIIPHTYERTIVSSWAPGVPVNIEFDLIGKYVTRWLDTRGDAKAGLTAERLKEMGF